MFAPSNLWWQSYCSAQTSHNTRLPFFLVSSLHPFPIHPQFLMWSSSSFKDFPAHRQYSQISKTLSLANIFAGVSVCHDLIVIRILVIHSQRYKIVALLQIASTTDNPKQHTILEEKHAIQSRKGNSKHSYDLQNCLQSPVAKSTITSDSS